MLNSEMVNLDLRHGAGIVNNPEAGAEADLRA
jgi:hypothetical protein